MQDVGDPTGGGKEEKTMARRQIDAAVMTSVSRSSDGRVTMGFAWMASGKVRHGANASRGRGGRKEKSRTMCTQQAEPRTRRGNAWSSRTAGWQADGRRPPGGAARSVRARRQPFFLFLVISICVSLCHLILSRCV